MKHAGLLVDKAWALALGWSDCLQLLLTVPVELTAASITLEYWGVNRLVSLWIFAFFLVVTFINVFGIRLFANIETVLSVIKLLTLLRFIILGILIDTGLGFHGKAIGVSNWYNPGATNNGFLGFCSVLMTAAFAYSGIEMVGLTAVDMENPQRQMPKAIKQVFRLIVTFYIGPVLLLGILVPYTDPLLLDHKSNMSSAASPFIIATKTAGIRVLPAILNDVILVTVLSVATTQYYTTSKLLTYMAKLRVGPQVFRLDDHAHPPFACYVLSTAVGALDFSQQQNFGRPSSYG